MSKRKERRKTAVFELEPDGFSIHTLELSQKLSGSEYRRIKDVLYKGQEQDGKVYIRKEGKGLRYYDKYAKHGIRILLEHFSGKSGKSKYFIRLIINPRKLIDPECSYLGILPPEKSSIEKMIEKLYKRLKGSVFENQVNQYYLSRIDLCVNIRGNNEKLFRELVRVLRKLPTPPKYKRMIYKDTNKLEANQYNKHYLRFHCGTHELVIYDKTYQMQEEGLAVSYEKLPEGVLRFEIHCERAYIRNMSKTLGKMDTSELLWKMVKESKPLIIKHFSRCFPDTEFVQITEIEDRIKKSSFKKKNKEMMIELARRLQRLQSVDKALEKMEQAGYDTSGLLDKFSKLGISPIPLWQNFCAKALPGPVELLRNISDGGFKVKYVEIKYK